MKNWRVNGGVLLVSYDLFRRLCDKNKQASEFLMVPGADVLVCDEGHLLKNEKTKLKQFIASVTTKRRIILTGTPVQNNLLEYYTMIELVYPTLLGTKGKFTERFLNPITNGQYFDSSPAEIYMMKLRSAILYKLLDTCVNRVDGAVLAGILKPKHEYIVYIPLTTVQLHLYKVSTFIDWHVCQLFVGFLSAFCRLFV